MSGVDKGGMVGPYMTSEQHKILSSMPIIRYHSFIFIARIPFIATHIH